MTQNSNTTVRERVLQALAKHGVIDFDARGAYSEMSDGVVGDILALMHEGHNISEPASCALCSATEQRDRYRAALEHLADGNFDGDLEATQLAKEALK